jgi:hypothetical protein
MNPYCVYNTGPRYTTLICTSPHTELQCSTCYTIAAGRRQGAQIGQIFNIGLLFTWLFLKFYLNNQFQNTVCCTYLNIQKHFDATIFDFQFELFEFGYSIGNISENWAIFFKLLVTLPKNTTMLVFLVQVDEICISSSCQ